MLLALTSLGHSPGVTTSALALAHSWPRPVLLAECDPIGGDVLARLDPEGRLVRVEPDGRMLRPSVVELLHLARTMPLDRALWQQTVCLAGAQQRWLLPGPSTPLEADSIAPAWPQLARLFAGLDGRDVLADCGRLRTIGSPAAVLAGANLTVLFLRGDVAGLSAVWRSIELVRAEVGRTEQGDDGLVAVIVGPGYPCREIERQLTRRALPVAGALPWDPVGATTVYGGGSRSGRRRSSALPTAAVRLAAELARLALARQQRLAEPAPGVGIAPNPLSAAGVPGRLPVDPLPRSAVNGHPLEPSNAR